MRRANWNCWLVALALLGIPAAIRANPHPNAPATPLAVMPRAECEALQQAAFALWQTNQTRLEGLQAKAAAGQLATAAVDDVGATHVALVQVRRLGERLSAQGQTAGVDFFFRAQRQQTEVEAVAAAYRRINGFSSGPWPQIQANMQVAARSGQAQLPAIQRLMQAEKWSEAETALHRVYDTLNRYAIWYGDGERGQFFRPYADVDALITAQLTSLRKAEAAAWWQAAAEALSQQIIAESKRFSDAAETHKQGQTTWQMEAVSGPQLVQHLGEHWQSLHLAALRARAFRQAQATCAAEAGPALAAIEALDKDVKELAATAIAAIVSVIENEATRIAPGDVPTRHAEYLLALAPLSLQAPQTDLTPRATKALERLRQRVPLFVTQAAAYRAATERTLLWRERVADVQQRRAAQDFPPLGSVLGNAVQPSPTTRGLLVQNKVTAQMQLRDPAPLAIAQLQTLLKSPARVSNCAALGWDTRTTAARYSERIYAAVPLAESTAWNTASEALTRDLLAGGDYPPLSLAAAQSLAALERGDLREVGGTVVDVHLESMLARFSAWPESGRGMVELGTLPTESSGGATSAVCVRCILTPQYVRHPHFLVRW